MELTVNNKTFFDNPIWKKFSNHARFATTERQFQNVTLSTQFHPFHKETFIVVDDDNDPRAVIASESDTRIPAWTSISYYLITCACNLHNRIMWSRQPGLAKFIKIASLALLTGIALSIFAIGESSIRLIGLLFASMVVLIYSCDWLGEDNPLLTFSYKYAYGELASLLTIKEAPCVAHRMLTEYERICRVEF